MKISRLLLAGALSLGAVAPVFAAEPAPQAPPAKDVTVAKPEKEIRIICRTMQVLGTRLGSKRVCLTKAQWEDRSFQDRQRLEKTQAQAPAPRM